MLSIGKLVAGAEDYYLRNVAAGLEEYYTGAGEAPGRWVGAACSKLSLSGEVESDSLKALLAGRSPSDLLPLLAPLRVGRVAGFDLTFSAPKSVSILYGLGAPGLSEAVRRSHDEAVLDGLRYLERHSAFVRRGHDGLERLKASGFVAAAFRHRTSRVGDPQLHTHVVVANVLEGSDGRWSSLFGSRLYHHGRTAGFVYQASLRAGLHQRLGVSFEPIRNGVAEVRGVPAQLLREFSTRRVQILAHLETKGQSSAAAAELATLATRCKKSTPSGNLDQSVAGLREHWSEKARWLGVEPRQLEAMVVGRERRLEPDLSRSAEIFLRLLGAEGLTARVSTFERRDVVRAIAESFPQGLRLERMEALSDQFLGLSEVVSLGPVGRGGEGLLTTREILSIERWLLRQASELAATGRGVVHEETVGEVLAGRAAISEEQRTMVRRLLTGGSGVDVVVGKAGSGKTFALDAARAAWEKQGYLVHGTALSARAAAELQEGAGVRSDTLARVFLGIDRGEAFFGPRDVVLLDEAGMVGTRAMARLIGEVTLRGGKVVLIGDPCQLPEIEAGGAFAALSRQRGTIVLRENHRQKESWERTALDELRVGKLQRAVAAYSEHERLHIADSALSARTALVRDWAEAEAGGERARMYAVRRADVEALNSLARVDLRSRRRIGRDLIVAAGRSFASGDEVLFCRNDRKLGFLNGDRGLVHRLDPNDGLVVETAKGMQHVPERYLENGHLSHGYAMTVHKSQGATVERAFVLGNDALFLEAGYVALSRAVARTDVYVVGAGEEGVGPSDLAADLLVDALSRTQGKNLALSMIVPTAVFGHRAAGRAFPGGITVGVQPTGVRDGTQRVGRASVSERAGVADAAFLYQEAGDALFIDVGCPRGLPCSSDGSSDGSEERSERARARSHGQPSISLAVRTSGRPVERHKERYRGRGL